MTKEQLLNQFALFEDFESKAQAGRAFDYLVDIISTQLKSGNSVALGQNFGEFRVATQAAKSGNVPGTDTAYSTPAKQVVKFRVSAPLKTAVAGA